jgi:hypothetical protein
MAETTPMSTPVKARVEAPVTAVPSAGTATDAGARVVVPGVVAVRLVLGLPGLVPVPVPGLLDPVLGGDMEEVGTGVVVVEVGPEVVVLPCVVVVVPSVVVVGATVVVGALVVVVVPWVVVVVPAVVVVGATVVVGALVVVVLL